MNQEWSNCIMGAGPEDESLAPSPVGNRRRHQRLRRTATYGHLQKLWRIDALTLCLQKMWPDTAIVKSL
jgi:hypothetical protein